nr:MAG TPA: hypothetical protein [Caudoviricetes sp.]
MELAIFLYTSPSCFEVYRKEIPSLSRRSISLICFITQ